MSSETFTVKALEGPRVRISVDSAGEEARGVTVDPREAIQQIADAANLIVEIVDTRGES